MKFISKLFNSLAVIFRILVTMTLFWGVIFTIFVNRNLLASFYDILGFDAIAPEIIKLITAIIIAFMFFINLLLTKRIFKANKTGQHHMSNLFFGIIFLLIDMSVYFFTREKNLYYFFAFSAFLILGSMFGLFAKAKGLYPKEEDLNLAADQNSNESNLLTDEKEVIDETPKEENLDHSLEDKDEASKELSDDQVYESLDNKILTEDKDIEVSEDKETIEKEELSEDKMEKDSKDLGENLKNEDDHKDTSKPSSDKKEESLDKSIAKTEENQE